MDRRSYDEIRSPHKPPSLNHGLLRSGERVAMAVSGGADSTALLLTLHERAAKLGIGLSAVDLHHGIGVRSLGTHLQLRR